MNIDIKSLYGDTAKLDQITKYLETLNQQPLAGQDVVLTGPGPVWLYLIIAHHLHGIVKSLSYSSPVTGEVPIFNHNPF